MTKITVDVEVLGLTPYQLAAIFADWGSKKQAMFLAQAWEAMDYDKPSGSRAMQFSYIRDAVAEQPSARAFLDELQVANDEPAEMKRKGSDCCGHMPGEYHRIDCQYRGSLEDQRMLAAFWSGAKSTPLEDVQEIRTIKVRDCMPSDRMSCSWGQGAKGDRRGLSVTNMTSAETDYLAHDKELRDFLCDVSSDDYARSILLIRLGLGDPKEEQAEYDERKAWFSTKRDTCPECKGTGEVVLFQVPRPCGSCQA